MPAWLKLALAVTAASALAFGAAFALADDGPEPTGSSPPDARAQPIDLDLSGERPAIASVKSVGTIPALARKRKKSEPEEPPTREPQVIIDDFGGQEEQSQPQEQVSPQPTASPVPRATSTPTFDPDPRD